MRSGLGNMKRILFFITIILSLCCKPYAQEYKLNEIEDVALSFLNRKSQNVSTRSNTATTKQIEKIEAVIRDGLDYMYIVNAENSAGWVIISNEKKYSTIIAHADSGTFVYEKDLLPPALLCILEQHMDAIDSTRINIEKNMQRTSIDGYSFKSTNDGDTVSPILLLRNRWKQSGNNGAYDENHEYDCNRVYNKFIPASYDISCGRAYVGCGAVAMAQLMSYWQWPDYAFIRDTIIAGVCSGSLNQRFYDWDNMPDQIDSTTTIYQTDAIAGLLRDCAYAANTVFWDSTWLHKAGSSALIGNINTALKNNFGFHTNRINEYSSTEMEPILRQEIDARRPVLCQAWKKDTTDGKSAHSFVIDGYKTFHVQEKSVTQFAINWGGGENRNINDIAYYSLDFDDYNRNRTFLTEIYPDCNERTDDILLSNADNIVAADKKTYYSGNDIIVCTNNNSIVVNSGAHLTLKAANQVRLKSGFHAQSGSNVHVSISPLPCDHPVYTASTSAQQRIAPNIYEDDTEPTNNIVTTDFFENINGQTIQSTSIYTISGQLVQTMEAALHDVAHLPDGMYILQYHMNDGNIRSTKIIK